MGMRPAGTYTPSDTYLREQTGNIIMFAHFEEGNILTKTRKDSESGDEYDDESIMSPLLSKEDMDAMDSGDKSDHDIISTEKLEDICDGSQTHPNFNMREARYKIRHCIKQRQLEWKGMLKYTQRMSKVLHKVFKTVVKDILQELKHLGESDSEVYYFIPEPRNFAEVIKLSDNIKKPWLKATL